MEIEREDDGAVAVIAPAGRIDTTTAPALEQALDEALAGGRRRVLVDLAKVPYISSGGLRVLLATAKRLREPGDRFGLAELAPEVEKVMRLTGFSSILACYPSRPAGIEALAR
jgi:anti-anti-sigma factor